MMMMMFCCGGAHDATRRRSSKAHALQPLRRTPISSRGHKTCAVHRKATAVGALSSPRRAGGQNQGCNVGNVKCNKGILKELQHEKNFALPPRPLRIRKSKLAPLV
jgi:hypothetical protein